MTGMEERFFTKIGYDPNGCWLWTAGANNRGYPTFSVNGKNMGRTNQ